MNNIRKIIGILISFQLFFSIYLAYAEYNSQGICIFGKACETVQNSVYGQLFGIKLTYLGPFAFLILFAFYYLSYKKVFYNLFLLAATLGAASASYLLYIQFFILKQICSTCFLIDSTLLLVFILTAADYFLNKNN